MNKKIDRNRAILNLGQEAERRLVKSEVMRFRLEEATFKRFLVLAKKLNKPAGALVREWVTEKLNQVENGHTDTPESVAISIIATSLAERGLLHDDQIGKIHHLLTGNHTSIVDKLGMPGGEDIEFKPARLRGNFRRPVDLS
jgi:predicted DNA-binding protein